LEIISSKSTLKGEVLVPGSKSHTIRAVIIAGLASGTSYLRNPLYSSDTEAGINGMKVLGANITTGEFIQVEGIGGIPQVENAFIDVANSGTSLRILTAIAALSGKSVSFDGDQSIRQRPMLPLLTALEKLGAVYQAPNGKCPFTIRGSIKGGSTSVRSVSSQFLTALLIAAPLAPYDTEIIVEELNEQPYVELTLDWLNKQGIQYEKKGLEWFRIKGGQRYKSFDMPIPADFSTATFHACAAAVTQSEILIKGLDFTDSQGDKVIFEHLKHMGMKFEHKPEGLLAKGCELQGIDIDMNATPDALPAMAVIGCFAKGTTRLLNVPQARLKECDRIKAAATELTKMGALVEELPEGLIIRQSELHGARVHGYDDHRMVMSLAIAGMAATGNTIVDTAESANVTYPAFVFDMQVLGAQLKTL
jgi:3-phosphoshikimate 1-carboxyvinyltransferase